VRIKGAISKAWRPLLVTGIALMLAGLELLPANLAFAHASFVRADPMPDSVLAQSPRRVSIWFTEPIEPAFSEIQVLDAEGRRVDNRDSVVDSGDPTAMSVGLPTLPNATYTVAWRNLSTVDGHTVRGSFVFSMGQLLANASPTEQIEQGLLQSPLEPVLRWLGLLGILAVVGGLGFELLVTRQVLTAQRNNEAVQRLGRELERRMHRLIWFAAGLFFLASTGQLMVQASIAQDVPLHKTLGGPVMALLEGTEWGHLWLWRMGLFTSMAAVLGFRFAINDRRIMGVSHRAAGLVLGAGCLLTLSLTSHAAATKEIQIEAIFSDYVHLLASGFWVGGLFHFALGLPLVMQSLNADQRRAMLAAMVPRFSTMAILSVGTLIITGLYSSWAQVTVLSALATPYGLTLLAKSALVAPLLLLGGVNLLWIRPRLAKEGRTGQWLHRLVTAEAILATLVLLTAGLLISLEPARQTASRQLASEQTGLVFQDSVEGIQVKLRIEPGQVGLNRVEVSLADRVGSPITNASDVSLRLKYLNADLGEDPATATPLGVGNYILDNALLNIAGPWQAELVVRRPDAFDARTAFRFQVASATIGSSGTIMPSAQTGKLLWGVELVLLGFLFLGVGIGVGGWRVPSGAMVMGPGAAAVLVGLFVVANVRLADITEPQGSSNPIPPSQESFNIGRQLYSQNCQSCHGATGRGDGPLAAGLRPPPLDLSVHVPLHSDNALFGFIRDGLSGTAMQPWRGKLTDAEIWHILNYLRTLVEVVDR